MRVKGVVAAGPHRPSDLLRTDVPSVVPAKADPAVFDRILSDPAFAEIEAYPHTSAFGRAYHPAIHGNRDCSFAIEANGAAVLACLCAPLDGKLGFYGMPLRLIAGRGLGDIMLRVAIQAAFLRLDEIAQTHGLREISVLDKRAAADSPITAACNVRGATMESHSIASVDLMAGPSAWRAALRKSSRSLINWGRRNLAISYVNKESPDRTLFERYRAFHADVAGRVTRLEESWNVMYEWIAQGRGELVLAFFECRLIAGSMFIDGKTTSIYASGVYDRAQFDKPLAHYPIWLGIERAHARGMKVLELGDVPERGAASDKEYQIGYFKRGFATHIEAHPVWRWKVRP